MRSFNRGNIEETNSSAICVWCPCIHVLFCLCRDLFCGLTWENIYEMFLSVHLLMTEFDCPEVTLCSWQDVKIQLLTWIFKLFSFVRDNQWDWMYKTMPMGHSTLSVKKHRKHIPANQQLYINETKSQAKLGWSLVSWLVYFHGWPIAFPEVASLILCHECQKCKHLMPTVKGPRHARSRAWHL